MKKPIRAFLLLLTVALLVVGAGNAQVNFNFSVKVMPDEPVVLERPIKPSDNDVWIDGEWIERNGQYVHQPGYWAVPERDHVWERGRWQRWPDGSVFWEPGYWKAVEHVGVPQWIPEPRYLKPPRPSERHIWVEGEWIWVNHRFYMYQVGYWALPEENTIFESGHWARWPNGEWYWVKGYWKRIPQTCFMKAIPPEPAFNRPPQPSPNHVWIDAEWSWQNNTFTFRPGHWETGDPHKIWIKGYWHQRQDGGYFWISGHWSWV